MDKNVVFNLLIIIVVGAVSDSVSGYSSSTIQGITVSNYNGILHCDQIECPRGTELCHVLKQSLGRNKSEIKRENICYNLEGGILKQKLWTEGGNKNIIVYVHMDMYLDGHMNSSSSTVHSKA